MQKDFRKEKVVKYMRWPRNGSDYRSAEKKLITTIQVHLVLILSENDTNLPEL